MPLTGELEHLPIVDVIQLIHSTRKSGTLNVYSRKGEGQLVFNNGYIVSATHSRDDLKIGKILLDGNAITQEDLDHALATQALAGPNQRPLIATLHEHCGLPKDAAYKALETLIELTVVEMVSWNKGVFTLDTEEYSIPDDYKYLPSDLKNVSLDTQMVLMDALRIFDEKVHSGEIVIADEPDENQMPMQSPFQAALSSGDSEVELSDDILGLADLDKIERKKPRVFQVLDAFDPLDIHRQSLAQYLPVFDEAERNKLVEFLSEHSHFDSGLPYPNASSQAVILYSADEFLQHAIMTVCKREGILTFATQQQDDLDNLINRTIAKGLEAIVVLSCPDSSYKGFDTETLMALRTMLLHKYSNISLIQLTLPTDYGFALESLNDGMRAVFPYPSPRQNTTATADDLVKFLKSFTTYVRSCFSEERRLHFSKLRNSLSNLRLLKKAPDISLSLLQFVSEFFPRSLTLVVDRQSLIVERSIGVLNDRASGPAAPLKIRIPVRMDSVFHDILNSGQYYIGETTDSMLIDLLYPEIGAPVDPTCLILPLRSNERTITLTYADFGHQQSKAVPVDFLEFFAGQTGLAMENALFRKQLRDTPRSDIIP